MREVIKEDFRRFVLIDGLETGLFGVERGEWMEEEKEKKPGFFERLKESKMKQVLFCVVCMAMLIGMYIPISVFFQIKSARRFDVVKDDFSWVYQIDEISQVENKIVLEGWAFKLNEDATLESYDVVLRNIDTEKRYYPKMQYYIREDINAYFQCEYDYKKTGFKAEIDLKKIPMEDATYEVILHPLDEEKAFATNVYYADGQMMFVNPEERVYLKVEGTGLEKIVRDGVLRVHRPDFGIYVYQYEDELYWITDKSFFFEEDKKTYMQYQLWTTQIENLPAHRLENEWYFDNIGFYLEDNEIIEWDTGKYRVFKAALPTSYAVCEIETGYYVDGKWSWVNHFRAYIE